MKISNETKIGALTSIAIVLLILGFNFLKGNSFTSKSTRYYAVFSNIQGLSNSNPVVINGKQVGTVYSTDGGRNMRRIIVALNMTQDVDIPDNSIATINPSLLGTTSVEIKLGTDTGLLHNADTIASIPAGGMFDEVISKADTVVSKKLDPVLAEVKITLNEVDSLLYAFNSVMNASTKENIKGTMANINKLTNTLANSLPKTMDNLNSFTGTLAANNDKMTQITSNVQTLTSNLSKLDLEKTLATVNATLGGLQTVIAKVNSNDGTLGKLINDNHFYNNLTATSNKLNLLLDDFRIHPKRYVSFSVFGKKDKGQPLMVPLADTVNAPYK